MDQDHVDIVKQGTKAIDEWRGTFPGERLDLSGASLTGLNLRGANLRGADLSGADLTRARLTRAILIEANLSGADLTRAILIEGDLSRCILTRAILSGANLIGADLSRAILIGADLSRAILIGADLNRAKLARAILTRAILVEVNLTEADLRASRLIIASLGRAELTGAKLYGTARDDWEIEGIKCKYVFWDPTGDERSPKDRDLEPGEFERLHAQLPTIEYVFENGMTPLDSLVMDSVVRAIREGTPEFDLQIDSVNARGLQPSIKFTVRYEDQKEPALAEIKQGYGAKVLELEAQEDVLYRLISAKLDSPRKVNIITAEQGSLVTVDGSSINAEHYIQHIEDIRRVIEDAPPENLTDRARRTALDVLSGALKDIVRGETKEAVKKIDELSNGIAPFITDTPAYEFFASLAGRQT